MGVCVSKDGHTDRHSLVQRPPQDNQSTQPFASQQQQSPATGSGAPEGSSNVNSRKEGDGRQTSISPTTATTTASSPVTSPRNVSRSPQPAADIRKNPSGGMRTGGLPIGDAKQLPRAQSQPGGVDSAGNSGVRRNPFGTAPLSNVTSPPTQSPFQSNLPPASPHLGIEHAGSGDEKDWSSSHDLTSQQNRLPHGTLYQVNSFADVSNTKSFRRQSYFGTAAGGGGGGAAGVFVPRVRTRSNAMNLIAGRGGSKASMCSVFSSDTAARQQSSAFVPSAAQAADLHSGHIEREDLLGESRLAATYLATEMIPVKAYYSLKAVHNRVNVSVDPVADQDAHDQVVSGAEQVHEGGEIHFDQSTAGKRVKGDNGLVPLTPDHLFDGIPCLPPNALADARPIDPRVSLSLTMLQKIGHKNMQSVYSVMTGADHILCLGQFYFTTSLQEELDKPYDDTKLSVFVKEVVKTLYYAHSHHIPHGHLTLSNVHSRDTDQHFVVSDFGLYHLFMQFTCDELFTMGYRDPALHPPERLASHLGDCRAKSLPVLTVSRSDASCETNGTLDAQAIDLWALGCSLYLKRFQKHPFEGRSANELHRNILSRDIELPSSVDPQLARLIRKLLSKDPTRRGPFSHVLREPFIRQRVDLSRSVRESNLLNPIWSIQDHSVIELGNSMTDRLGASTSRKSPRHRMSMSTESKEASNGQSGALSVPEEALSASSQNLAPPSFFYVEEQVHCSHCNTPVRNVCYLCTHCTDYRVCKNCYYQNLYSHDPSHHLQCHAVDATVPHDEQPHQGPRSHRGTIMISTKQLTERESTIFVMTGQLPTCLDVERAAGASTARDRTQLLQGKQLMTEAAAMGEESVEAILDNSVTNQSPEMLLSNLDLTEMPIGLLEPLPFLHITVLDLANNFLTHLPESIEYLVNLRRLLLGNNKLSALPESIGNLADLETLDVNHNLLSSLPQSLMFCDQMEVLALDYNQFTEIPELIADIEVRYVYLAANSGICEWPSPATLSSFPKGITLGIDNEPSLYSSHFAALKEMPNISIMWNKIYPDYICPGIYLGSLRSAQMAAVYEKLNIKYLLTMGRGLEPQPPEGGHHKTVIVDDIEGASIDFAFEEAVAFMDEAQRSGSGCLVHCFAGMSRSATTVVAYLMMRKGMRLDEAYCLTKRGRPAIYPNAGFFSQLVALDAKLFPGQRPLDMASMERDKKPV